MEGKEKQSLFSRLAKTRDFLTGGLRSVISQSSEIDAGMLDDIEDQLILADLGVEFSREVVDRLRANIRSQRIATATEVHQELREDIVRILQPVARPWQMPARVGTRVVLVGGVNGVAKRRQLLN